MLQTCKRLNEEKAKELKDSLAQIEEQLTTAKTEISEKVHTENVKCYRNISDLFRRKWTNAWEKLTVMESRMYLWVSFSPDGNDTWNRESGGVTFPALLA